MNPWVIALGVVAGILLLGEAALLAAVLVLRKRLRASNPRPGSLESLRRKLVTEFPPDQRLAAEGALRYLDAHMGAFTTPERRPASVIAGKISALRLSGGDVEHLRAVVMEYPDIRELQQLSETPLEMDLKRRCRVAGREASPEELRAVRQRDREAYISWLQQEEPRQDPEFEAATAWLWDDSRHSV